MLVGRDFPFLGILTFETFEVVGNIIWRGKVNTAGVIIPIESESKVSLAFPVLCNVIVLFDAFNLIISMILNNIIYPKIVHDKRETDRPPFVGP